MKPLKGCAMKDQMVGKKYGLLQVLSIAEIKNKAQHKAYLCKCDCGNQKIIIGASIRAGRSKSCGCLSRQSQFTSSRTIKHGQSRSKTYQIWIGMKNRCADYSKGKTRKNYYDKGIKVCKEWQIFENFYNDMGQCPEGMTIERIDSNGNYEPLNCKWATPKEQANNTSANHLVEYDGKRQTISQWAEQLGIKPNTLTYRLKRAFTADLHK